MSVPPVTATVPLVFRWAHGADDRAVQILPAGMAVPVVALAIRQQLRIQDTTPLLLRDPVTKVPFRGSDVLTPGTPLEVVRGAVCPVPYIVAAPLPPQQTAAVVNKCAAGVWLEVLYNARTRCAAVAQLPTDESRMSCASVVIHPDVESLTAAEMTAVQDVLASGAPYILACSGAMRMAAPPGVVRPATLHHPRLRALRRRAAAALRVVVAPDTGCCAEGTTCSRLWTKKKKSRVR